MTLAGALAPVVRIGAVARKELRHVSRDWRLLALVLIVPVLQLVLFAYAISFDVRHLATVVVDQDRTSHSRDFGQALGASDLFTIIQVIDDPTSIDALFRTGRARVVVVIPAGFGAALDGGLQANVGAYVDGSQTTIARVSSAQVQAFVASYGRPIAMEWADRAGLDTASIGLVQPSVRTWYNPELSSAVFLVPGLVVVIVMIVTVQQTAVSLVREKEIGSDEQMRLSPLTPGEMTLGKLLPWTGIAFVDMAMVTAVGGYGFGVPLRGSVWVLALGGALFVACCLGLGLVISAIANSIEVANVVALMASFLPAFLLSGFAFPLEAMPQILQWLSWAFPARPMLILSRSVFLKGAGLTDVAPQLTVLAGYAAVVLLLAAVLSRRRGAR